MNVRVPSTSPAELASAIVRNPLVVTPRTTVGDAIAHMNALHPSLPATEESQWEALQREERLTCVLVVEDHQLVGIVTERDIIRLGAPPSSPGSQPIREVMAPSVISLRESAFTQFSDAVHLLQEHRIHHLPVVDDHNYPVGFITQASVLRALNPLGLHQLVEVLESKIALLEATVEALVVNPETEAALHQAVVDTRWQFALEGAGDGVWDWNLETNQVFFSPHWKTMLGYADDEVGDRLEEWSRRIYPEDRDRCFATLNQYFQGETPFYQNEHRVRCKDGHYKWILARGKVVAVSPTGHPLRMIGTHTDISDRKQAELALAESERKLSTLISNLPGYVYRVQATADYPPIFISNGVTAITGYSVEEYLLGRSTSGAHEIHPDDADAVWETVQQALNQHQPYECEYRLMTKLGDEKWVWERGQGIYSEHGEPLFLEGFVTDITAHKMAEQALREAKLEQERAEDALRQVTVGTATTIGGDFFPALVSHIAEALDVRYVSISQATPDGFQVLAFFADGTLTPPELLPYCSVPCCVQALERGEWCHPDGIQELYPDNALFTRLGVESYLGVGLRSAAGEPSGNLCILHDRPLPNPDWARTLLRIFAARAGAELERYQTAQALENLTAELEQRIQERTLQLQAREAQLEDLFDNANDLIQSVWLENGTFEYVNRAWREILGYSEAEVAQLTLFDVLHPAYHDHCQGLMAQLREGAVCALDRMELTFLTRDHREILVEGSLNCRLEGDRPVSTRAIFRDITERKAWEQRLQEREARYRAVMDHASDAIFLANRQGYLIEVNRKAEELLGYSREALIQRHVSQIHPPHVLDAVARHFSGILEKNHGPSFETLVLREDGSCVPVDITGSRIYFNGEPIAQGIFRDIRDRKQAENALRESQQFLQTVLDTIPLAVFWKDRNLVYLGCNRRFLQDAGLSSVDALVGKTDYDMPWGETEAGAYRADDQNVITFETAQLEIIETLRQASGQQIWLETNKFPLYNVTGDLVGVLGTYQDISDRKQAEDIICQQAEREVLLREITQRIRQSLELQTIFDTACQEIRQLFLADRVGIFKFYPESGYDMGEFVAESVVAGFSSVVAIRVDDHCFGEKYAPLYIKGRYAAMEDIYDLEICHTTVLAQFQVRANLVMPLICGEHLWGLLCIHQCARPRHWEESEINLAQQLANQLVIAIQQASLYEQVQVELQVRQQAEARLAQQLRQQKTLGSIIQHIRESLDLDAILATVTRQVKDVFQSDRVIVVRLLPGNKGQIVEEAVSPGLPALKDHQWPDETWSPETLNHYHLGQPRIFLEEPEDAWKDCLVTYSTMGAVQSKMVAPILQEMRDGDSLQGWTSSRNNRLWGVLVVHSCKKKRIWRETEAQLLQQIANQLAIAIQQASLFKQLQQELTERQQTQLLLTERNQQLAISNEELARATRLKDEFLANMSHELRTPLNAILGMTEGLQEAIFGTITEQQEKALQTVERSASHLLALINDILDVAKIESGQIELECFAVSLVPLCSASLAFIKQQALKKQIQVKTNIPADLPNLWVDERRIRQVLINLLSNAIKFTPEGGSVTLTASPSFKTEDSSQPTYLRLAVHDTGIGIAPDNIKKLFQPFVQIDSALNRQYTGTGLGLALVKQIVELHGGQVGLTSKVGMGSCFTIDLPCAPADTTGYEAPSASSNRQDDKAPEPGLVVPMSSPLILLAEDNEANISTIAGYLRAKGYQILLAHNGQEAIALVQAEHPNLILMDIQMPGMDGLEVIQHLRQDPDLGAVPIIALTALAMAGDRERCLAAGASEYLAKPVKLKQLALLIQKLLPKEV